MLSREVPLRHHLISTCARGTTLRPPAQGWRYLIFYPCQQQPHSVLKLSS